MRITKKDLQTLRKALFKGELEDIEKGRSLIEELEKEDKIKPRKNISMFTCYRDFEAQSEDRIKNPTNYYYWRWFNQSLELKISPKGLYYCECKGFEPFMTLKPDTEIEKRHTDNKIKNYTKVGYFKSINKAILQFHELTWLQINGIYQPDRVKKLDQYEKEGILII